GRAVLAGGSLDQGMRTRNLAGLRRDPQAVLGHTRLAMSPQRGGLLSNLYRRLPRVLFPYVAGSWGIVQVADWTVNRYVLSPRIVDLIVYLTLLFLPSVLLLAYFRGEPGATPWTRTEKLALPLNLLIGAIIIVALFHGKDLGAATRTVVLKDASGVAQPRQVPKQEFRKHLAVFSFDNESGDANLNWLRQGLPYVISIDLEQDLFMSVADPYDF